jgi:hypothetical protein
MEEALGNDHTDSQQKEGGKLLAVNDFTEKDFPKVCHVYWF